MIKTLRFSLLSMLMMLCGSVFAADDVTISAEKLSGLPEGPVTVSGYTFTAEKNNGSTAPAYNTNGKDVRLYAKNTLTIKAASGNMTKIVFNISAQGKKRLAPITASTGTIAAQASGDETVTWTGNANEVTFTVGEKAVYGSDGAEKAGQFDFVSVVFGAGGEGGEGGGGGGDPQPTTSRNYKKVSAVTSGKAYLLVADGKAAQPVPEGKSYGYLGVKDVTDNNGVISVEDASQEYVITQSGNGYTIQQPDGRLFRNDANYKTVSVDETVTTTVWTITANGDGTFMIKNAETGKWLQLDPQYGTYGVYDEEKGAMPALYEFDSETKPEAKLTISGNEEFEGSTTVTITPSNPDNLVYYTLDGSDPKTNNDAFEYTAPFTITETTTVKAYEEGAELTAEKTFTKKVVDYPEAADIAAFKALDDKTVAKLTLKDAKVVYTWSSNNGNTSTYVRDNSGAIVFYNTGLDLKANQVVNGTVVLKYSVYNNLPEAVKADASDSNDLVITDGEAAEAKAIEVSAAADNLCDLVVLDNVKVVKEEDGKFYAVKGADKVQIYNGFHLAAFDNLDSFLSDEENMSVKGIMVVFNTTYEIYPVEDGIVTGIDDVNRETVVGGKMFNIAGQRVNDSYKGIVIMNGKKMIQK